MKQFIKYLFVVAVLAAGSVADGLAVTLLHDTGELVLVQSKQDVTVEIPYGLFTSAMDTGGIEVRLYDHKARLIELIPCFSSSFTINESNYSNLTIIEVKSAVFDETFVLD